MHDIGRKIICISLLSTPLGWLKIINNVKKKCVYRNLQFDTTFDIVEKKKIFDSLPTFFHPRVGKIIIIMMYVIKTTTEKKTH